LTVASGIDLAALAAFKLEQRSQQDRLEQLMALLAEHGIPLPPEDSLLGASGQEHYQACRAVVVAAYELIERLEELREIVGSGHELFR
jgi:hypothetical protein